MQTRVSWQLSSRSIVSDWWTYQIPWHGSMLVWAQLFRIMTVPLRVLARCLREDDGLLWILGKMSPDSCLLQRQLSSRSSSERHSVFHLWKVCSQDWFLHDSGNGFYAGDCSLRVHYIWSSGMMDQRLYQKLRWLSGRSLDYLSYKYYRYKRRYLHFLGKSRTSPRLHLESRRKTLALTTE